MFAIEVPSISASADSDTVYVQCFLADKVNGVNQQVISFSVNVPKSDTSTLADYEAAAKEMARGIVEQICGDILGTE